MSDTTMEQFVALVQELWAPRWTRKVADWTPGYMRVLYEAGDVGHYPLSTVRRVMLTIAGKASAYAPSASEIRRVFTEIAPARRAAAAMAQRPDCKLCEGSGRLTFSVQVDTATKRPILASLSHWLTAPSGEGWYEYSIRCQCLPMVEEPGWHSEARALVMVALEGFREMPHKWPRTRGKGRPLAQVPSAEPNAATGQPDALADIVADVVRQPGEEERSFDVAEKLDEEIPF